MDVLGAPMAAVTDVHGWTLFRFGAGGWRRRAEAAIPASPGDDGIAIYLVDLFHGAVTSMRGEVVRLR